MEKLPEKLDRRRGDACTEKEPSRQKKETHFLSAVTSEMTTLKSFLLLVGGPMHPSLGVTLVNLSTRTSCLFTNDPRIKTPNNELIKITPKTPYNGLNNYN